MSAPSPPPPGAPPPPPPTGPPPPGSGSSIPLMRPSLKIPSPRQTKLLPRSLSTKYMSPLKLGSSSGANSVTRGSVFAMAQSGGVPSITSMGGMAAVTSVPVGLPPPPSFAPPASIRPPPLGRSGSNRPKPPPSFAPPPSSNRPKPPPTPPAQGVPSAAPASPVLSAAQIKSDTVALLREVYSKFAPEKLEEVENMIVRFAGREDEVVEVLKSKYGEAEVVRMQRDLHNARKRLRAVYAICDPYTPPSDVEDMLNNFAGDEENLLDGLRQRLGGTAVDAALRTVRLRQSPPKPPPKRMKLSPPKPPPTAPPRPPPAAPPAPPTAKHPAQLTVEDLGHEAVLYAVYRKLVPTKVGAVPALAKKFARFSTTDIIKTLRRKYGAEKIDPIVEAMLAPPPPAAPKIYSPSPPFEVGTPVEARYMAGTKWFAGTISAADPMQGIYSVTYDDRGDVEPDIPERLIKVQRQFTSAPKPPAPKPPTPKPRAPEPAPEPVPMPAQTLVPAFDASPPPLIDSFFADAATTLGPPPDDDEFDVHAPPPAAEEEEEAAPPAPKLPAAPSSPPRVSDVPPSPPSSPSIPSGLAPPQPPSGGDSSSPPWAADVPKFQPQPPVATEDEEDAEEEEDVPSAPAAQHYHTDDELNGQLADMLSEIDELKSRYDNNGHNPATGVSFLLENMRTNRRGGTQSKFATLPSMQVLNSPQSSSRLLLNNGVSTEGLGWSDGVSEKRTAEQIGYDGESKAAFNFAAHAPVSVAPSSALALVVGESGSPTIRSPSSRAITSGGFGSSSSSSVGMAPSSPQVRSDLRLFRQDYHTAEPVGPTVENQFLKKGLILPLRKTSMSGVVSVAEEFADGSEPLKWSSVIMILSFAEVGADPMTTPAWRLDSLCCNQLTDEESESNVWSQPRVFGPSLGKQPIISFVPTCTSGAFGFAVQGVVEYKVDDATGALVVPPASIPGGAILRLATETDAARGRWVHDLRCALSSTHLPEEQGSIQFVTSGDGLTYARAGLSAEVVVSATDSRGGVCRLGVSGGSIEEDNKDLSLTCLSAFLESDTLRYDLSEAATQLADGSCRFSYYAQRPGLYTLSIFYDRTYNGGAVVEANNATHIPGSPWKIDVLPAMALARHSSCGGPGLVRAESGELNYFTLAGRDALDCITEINPKDVRVAISPSPPAMVHSIEAGPRIGEIRVNYFVQVTSQQDNALLRANGGNLECSVMLVASGDGVMVAEKLEHVRGSPFRIPYSTYGGANERGNNRMLADADSYVEYASSGSAYAASSPSSYAERDERASLSYLERFNPFGAAAVEEEAHAALRAPRGKVEEEGYADAPLPTTGGLLSGGGIDISAMVASALKDVSGAMSGKRVSPSRSRSGSGRGTSSGRTPMGRGARRTRTSAGSRPVSSTGATPSPILHRRRKSSQSPKTQGTGRSPSRSPHHGSSWRRGERLTTAEMAREMEEMVAHTPTTRSRRELGYGSSDGDGGVPSVLLSLTARMTGRKQGQQRSGEEEKVVDSEMSTRLTSAKESQLGSHGARVRRRVALTLKKKGYATEAAANELLAAVNGSVRGFVRHRGLLFALQTAGITLSRVDASALLNVLDPKETGEIRWTALIADAFNMPPPTRGRSAADVPLPAALVPSPQPQPQSKSEPEPEPQGAKARVHVNRHGSITIAPAAASIERAPRSLLLRQRATLATPPPATLRSPMLRRRAAPPVPSAGSVMASHAATPLAYARSPLQMPPALASTVQLSPGSASTELPNLAQIRADMRKLLLGGGGAVSMSGSDNMDYMVSLAR